MRLDSLIQTNSHGFYIDIQGAMRSSVNCQAAGPISKRDDEDDIQDSNVQTVYVVSAEMDDNSLASTVAM